MLIQELKEILQDLNDKFLNTFSEVFENISQKQCITFKIQIMVNFVFQSFYKLYSHACNLHL